jgi:hypothetical protein
VPTSLVVRGWCARNRPIVRIVCAVVFGVGFLRINKRVC